MAILSISSSVLASFRLENTTLTRLSIRPDRSMAARVLANVGDAGTAAILYGPIVLAGCLHGLSPAELNNHNTAPGGPPSAVPLLSIDRDNLAASIVPAGKPLEFRARAKDADVVLAPLYCLFGKRYAVYWKLAPKERANSPLR